MIIPAFLIGYSNSSFTNPHEAMLPDEPKDCRGSFTHMGAKYWGYETDRHKATKVAPDAKSFSYDHDAHHWMRIGLKSRAQIDQITVSTKWYTANQVRAVSITLIDEMTGKEVKVLERQNLNPDADHTFPIPPTLATEALVDCYYEGGISRVNFFGEMAAEQPPLRPNLLETAELSHISNEHYGKPSQTVFANREQMHMVGWESARTGFGEQAVFHLKTPARVEEIVVDTYLHRLNAPLSSHAFGINLPTGDDLEEAIKVAPRWKLVFDGNHEVIPDHFATYMLNQKYLNEPGVNNNRKFSIRLHHAGNSPWKPLLSFAPLSPDTFHRFKTIEHDGPVTHILYMHYPHGGVHALKVYGKAA
ncbi:MAG: hypothetical protein ACXW30_00900 [Micavibrio sp.]